MARLRVIVSDAPKNPLMRRNAAGPHCDTVEPVRDLLRSIGNPHGKIGRKADSLTDHLTPHENAAGYRNE
jgi:hypothetical protein